jgi:thiol:disulfide interchange protein DsbD
MEQRMPTRGRALLAAFLALLGAVAALAPQAFAADAGIAISRSGGNGDDFLPVEKAFQVTAEATAADRIEVDFRVAKGYYLYRDKLKFQAPGATQAALGKPALPEGETKNDEFFGEQVVYHNDITVQLPVTRAERAAFSLPVKISYQGCADAGLCYPPTTHTIDIQLPEAGGAAMAQPLDGQIAGDSTGGYVSEQAGLARLITSGNVLLMMGAFFLSGLLLAFTPCVLPMVPIVSGIIAGQGENLTRMRGFSLSLTYVLGMALTYTAAGVAFAAAGQQAQTIFQQPWIIILFSLLFVAMAASMFGFYTVQMPSFVQTRLADISNRQRSGSYAGVAMMGALSALIVTTCVGPALVAALTVIGQTGQMMRGGLALFSMAIGMGVPLLVVGASAGQLLPRAGAWMDTVKQVFGALMLAVAVWMISRILPERVTMMLWAVPLLALGIVLRRATARSAGGRIGLRAASSVALIYGVFLLAAAWQGQTDPLRPLQRAEQVAHLPFTRIKSMADLEREVAAAKAAGRPVMLDFYADWCVSCKEMEKYTFPDPAVRGALANAVLLQADVTANDEADQALLKHFGIFGPPTIAFYGPDGVERENFRVVGFMKAAQFGPLALQATAAQLAGQP